MPVLNWCNSVEEFICKIRTHLLRVHIIVLFPYAVVAAEMARGKCANQLQPRLLWKRTLNTWTDAHYWEYTGQVCVITIWNSQHTSLMPVHIGGPTAIRPQFYRLQLASRCGCEVVARLSCRSSTCWTFRDGFATSLTTAGQGRVAVGPPMWNGHKPT